MAQFVDRPLPASLELPRLQDPRPRHRGTENLRNGPGTGRIKGVQNRICRDLKEGLLESAILHGYDGAGQDGLIGFCLHLAKRHPKAHCNLLAKLLPYNMNATVTGPTISSINIVSIPSGGRLSPEQQELAQQGKPFTIDYDGLASEPVPGGAEPREALPKQPILPESETMTPGEMQLLTELNNSISALARQVGVSLNE